MNIADVQAFVVIADLRSIVSAANQLQLSQSAVTRRLQNLEDQLGAKLFYRESRPMTLTKEGAEVYQYAKGLLASAADMEAALTPGENISGDFDVGVSQSLGDISIGPALESLHRTFPKLRVRATTDESTVLLQRLEKRELDVAAIVLPEGQILPEGVAGELLCTAPLVVVGPKSLRFGATGKLQDLAKQSWLVNPPGCGAREALQVAFARFGGTPNIVLESSSPGLKLSLIASGHGLGVFFPHIVRNSRFENTTRIIQPSDFGPRNSIWLVHHPNCGRLKAPITCIREAVQRGASETATEQSSSL